MLQYLFTADCYVIVHFYATTKPSKSPTSVFHPVGVGKLSNY